MIIKLINEAMEEVDNNIPLVMTIVICEFGLALLARAVCSEDKAQSFWHIFFTVHKWIAEFTLCVGALVLGVGLLLVIWGRVKNRLSRYYIKSLDK